MAAAFHRDQQVVGACEADRRLHVGGTGRLRDERGMFVERRVQHQPRLVVAVVAGDQQLASHLRGEIADVSALEKDRASVAGDGGHIGDGAGADHRVRGADAGQR